MGIFSSIIGGLFGLAGQSMQQSYTKENMKLQNVLNKDQMKYNDQLNRGFQDMLWNNQYSKEMSGMKGVGLNPATANGTSMGGMSASNNVGSGTSGPPGASVDIAGSAAAFAGIEQQQQQIDIARANSDAQTQLMDAQRAYYEALAGKVGKETTGVDLDNQQKQTYLENHGVEKSIAKMVAETNLTNQQALETVEKTKLWCAETGVAEANRDKVIQETINAKQQLENLKVEMGAIAYENALKQALAYQAYKQGNLAEANKLLAEAQTETENKTRNGKVVAIQLDNNAQRIYNTISEWNAGVLHYVDQKKMGENMQRKSTVDSYSPLTGVASSGGVAAGGVGTLIKALK